MGNISSLGDFEMSIGTCTLRLVALGAALALLASGVQAATLQVDMSTGAGLAAQAGWESISGTGAPSGTFSGYTDLAAGNITVSLSNISYDRLYRNGFTDATPDDFPGTDLDEMYGDLLFRNNASAPIDITISGLKAGTYQVTTHHLHAGGAVTPSEFDLDVQDADSPAFGQSVGNFTMGLGLGGSTTFDPTVVMFNVESNGTDPIILRMNATFIGTGGNTGGWYGFNGLEIDVVPEPASLASGLLGLTLIGLRRRRS
jgi:hypothetical protein